MIADGWLDWSSRRPGPAFKVYDTTNMGEGIVWHSMEGWLAGSFAELDKKERQASWMFSISKEGSLYQHYPITASCWASGNGLANTHWWSVELEGNYTMPISEVQQATALRLIDEWAATRPEKVISRTGDLYSQTMWEHREVDTLATPNAGETACPSERYQPLWAALAAREAQMAGPSNEELNRALVRREALRHIASDPDISVVDAAIDALKVKGLVNVP